MQALRTSWDVAGKAFFAIKVCEILKRVDPGWAKRLRSIGQNLGLSDSVLAFVGAVVDPNFAESQPPPRRPVQFRLAPAGAANPVCVERLPRSLYWNLSQNNLCRSS